MRFPVPILGGFPRKFSCFCLNDLKFHKLWLDRSRMITSVSRAVCPNRLKITYLKATESTLEASTAALESRIRLGRPQANFRWPFTKSKRTQEQDWVL